MKQSRGAMYNPSQIITLFSLVSLVYFNGEKHSSLSIEFQFLPQSLPCFLLYFSLRQTNFGFNFFFPQLTYDQSCLHTN